MERDCSVMLELGIPRSFSLSTEDLCMHDQQCPVGLWRDEVFRCS
jgi:hypothetical protein